MLNNPESEHYNLRNYGLRIPRIRLEIFRKSFFPTSIRLWNELADEIKSKQSIAAFKQSVKERIPKKEILYYGERWPSVHHTRLRIGCSLLREHLYNMHVVDNTLCRCGAEIEDTSHYLLACPMFDDKRDTMLNTISRISMINLDVLLFGNPLLSLNDNRIIFGAVHKFIIESRRFS